MALVAIGKVMRVTGEVMIGWAAYVVHRDIGREHKIDKVVLKDIQDERVLALLGIVFIIGGFILENFGGDIL